MDFITPIWIDARDADGLPEELQEAIQSPAPVSQTHIYLPLKPDLQGNEHFLASIDSMLDPEVLPPVLLNLRKLRRFAMQKQFPEGYGSEVLVEKSEPVPGDPTLKTFVLRNGILGPNSPKILDIHDRMEHLRACVKTPGEKERREEIPYRVVTCTVEIPKHVREDETSRKVSQTDICIAFPLGNIIGSKHTPRFPVYAGLPVMEVGFPFALNCDWLLVTSRESVRDCLWNRCLRDWAAALLVTVLREDPQLRRSFPHLLPPEATHDTGPWWGRFCDEVMSLVKINLPALLDEGRSGPQRQYRLPNPEILALVPREVLARLTSIHVLDEAAGVALKGSLDTLSCADLLGRLHDGSDPENSSDAFLEWMRSQTSKWMRRLFEILLEETRLNPELIELCASKPLFQLRPLAGQPEDADQRFCSLMPSKFLDKRVFFCPDLHLRMWRSDVLIVDARSEAEAAFIKGVLEELTPSQLVNHIVMTTGTAACPQGFSPAGVLWQDLLYLRNHMDDLRALFPETLPRLLVPVCGRSSMTASVTEAMLPTVLGLQLPVSQTGSTPVIQLPYGGDGFQGDFLLECLQWEEFFLEAGCKPLQPLANPIGEHRMPLELPCLTEFSADAARIALKVLDQHSQHVWYCLSKAMMHTQQGEYLQVRSVCDRSCFHSHLLPTVEIPAHARELAKRLGVTVEPDADFVAKGLQHLKTKGGRNLAVCQQWLILLQHAISSSSPLDSEPDMPCDSGLRKSIVLYFPDQDAWLNLEQVVCVPVDLPDKGISNDGIVAVCNALGMAVISKCNNSAYMPFMPLLVGSLKCSDIPSMEQALQALRVVAKMPHHFLEVGHGGCKLLSDEGAAAIMQIYSVIEGLLSKEFGNPVNFQPRLGFNHADPEWRRHLRIAANLPDLMAECHAGDAFPFRLYNDMMTWDANQVEACVVPCLLDTATKADKCWDYLHPDFVFACPLLIAALRVPYMEHRFSFRCRHDVNCKERELPEMSKLFREVVGDEALTVVTAKLIKPFIQAVGDPSIAWHTMEEETEELTVQTDLPYVVMGSLVICKRLMKNTRQNHAVLVLALARLLEARKGISATEALQIAREEMLKVSSLREAPWQGGQGDPTASELGNTLFPNRDSMVVQPDLVLAGVDFSELAPWAHDESADLNGGQTLPAMAASCESVSADHAKENLLLEARVQELFAIAHSEEGRAEHTIPRFTHSRSTFWLAEGVTPAVQNLQPAEERTLGVDVYEQKRVGDCAEHFVHLFLRQEYGAAYNPGEHWISSTRLRVLPTYGTRNIDDSMGYDFVLDDIKQLFSCSENRNMRCHIEVKGCSGKWDGTLHISANEVGTRDEIQTLSSAKAYILVVVEHVGNPRATRIAAALNWSQDFKLLHLQAESYIAVFHSTRREAADGCRDVSHIRSTSTQDVSTRCNAAGRYVRKLRGWLTIIQKRDSGDKFGFIKSDNMEFFVPPRELPHTGGNVEFEDAGRRSNGPRPMAINVSLIGDCSRWR